MMEQNKKRLVVLTGAGMSAESGIRTFRDADGLWEEYRVEDVASIEGYERNPSLVIDFYNQRRRQLAQVKPCRGHELLAALEQEYEVIVVTQNIDNLHERAGSSRVIHLHGELTKATSTKNPQDESCIVDIGVTGHIDLGDKAADGSQLRPYIVWFGEAVPLMERAIEETLKADIFLVIGTSLNVYPAAGLLHYVPSQVPVFLIDPNSVTVHRQVRVIRQGASDGMETFIEMLKNNNLKV